MRGKLRLATLRFRERSCCWRRETKGMRASATGIEAIPTPARPKSLSSRRRVNGRETSLGGGSLGGKDSGSMGMGVLREHVLGAKLMQNWRKRKDEV